MFSVCLDCFGSSLVVHAGSIVVARGLSSLLPVDLSSQTRESLASTTLKVDSQPPDSRESPLISIC